MHTCTSIYLHVVFATWSRRPLLTTELRPRLHAVIAASARNIGVFDVYVGGFIDHVHLLGRFDPVAAPSDVIGKIKQSASRFMREEMERERFRWQRGYSAFSVSRDRVSAVVRYIARQEQHHARRDFRDELRSLLEECGFDLAAAELL